MCNKNCMKKGIRQDDLCKLCNYSEDENHIFRDCRRARQIWDLIDPNFLTNSGDINFLYWLDFNLKSKGKYYNASYGWNTLFATTVWTIWKARNNVQFNDQHTSTNQIVSKSKALAVEVSLAFSTDRDKSNANSDKLISWSFPNAGVFKINTDGSVDQWQRGSFGGLVRSDRGMWIEGFCGNIGCAIVIKTELWAIRHALLLCKERNWNGVHIESDCQLAVQLIEGDEDGENHPDRVMIEDCRNLIRLLQTAVVHTLREANRCADKLAKLGAKQHESVVRMMVPPEDIIEDLKADLQGTAFPRGAQ